MMHRKRPSLPPTGKPSLASRLLANTVIRFTAATVGALVCTLLIFLLMQYLIGMYNKSGANTAYQLFYLDMIELRRQRPRRPEPPPPPPDVQRYPQDGLAPVGELMVLPAQSLPVPVTPATPTDAAIQRLDLPAVEPGD